MKILSRLIGPMVAVALASSVSAMAQQRPMPKPMPKRNSGPQQVPQGTTVAPMAGSSQASQRALPPDAPTWLKGLPDPAAVQALYAETGDERPREPAAFAVLVDYIEVLSGVDQKLMGEQLVAQLPPAAVPFWSQYVGNGYSKTLTRQPWRLFTKPEFRAEVLSHFVSDSSAAAYETARNRIPGVAGASNAPPANATLRILARDKKEAKEGHVSLSVFGIDLGEPLELPECAALAPFQRGNTSCIDVSQDAMMPQFIAQMLRQSTNLSLAAVPTGFTVKLARSKCPKWVVGCNVYLDLQDGVQVGLFVQTVGGDTETVEDALKEKYGADHEGVGPDGFACSNNLTGIVLQTSKNRHWRLPGLLVDYSPLVDCNLRMGTVAIKFRSIREQAAQNEKRQRDAGPKM